MKKKSRRTLVQRQCHSCYDGCPSRVSQLLWFLNVFVYCTIDMHVYTFACQQKTQMGRHLFLFTKKQLYVVFPYGTNNQIISSLLEATPAGQEDRGQDEEDPLSGLGAAYIMSQEAVYNNEPPGAPLPRVVTAQTAGSPRVTSQTKVTVGILLYE